MIITLLTDFGLQDPYVGVMKGVILGICPDAQIVDICHEIPPHQIDAAAFILGRICRYFPDDTIHCVVVDPGVGSDREALIVQAGNQVFVAPDNGVLTHIFHEHPDCRVYRANQPDYFLPEISRTFHGRDVFAPVAAHLASGIVPEKIGISFQDYIRREIHSPVVEGHSIVGEIVYFDRFGNVITNIDASLIAGYSQIQVVTGKHHINSLVSSYSEVDPGEPLAIVGSFGSLEVAVREGNAQEKLGLRMGDRVDIRIEAKGKK